MIASVSGVLAQRDTSLIVITTDGGVGYELHVPLGVFERLPATGARVTLFTELVVREDSWALYGFDRAVDRVIFQRLLGASGFGPRLALALISALSAERTVRAIRSKELAILSTVPGIGKKKAERLVLELHDKFGDIELGSSSLEPLSEADESVHETSPGTEPTETETTPTEPTQGDPVAGKQVFTGPGGCGACHTLSDAGASAQVGPNLVEAKPDYDLVVTQVTNGGGGMPPFEGTLTEEQIDDVAAYVSSVTQG